MCPLKTWLLSQSLRPSLGSAMFVTSAFRWIPRRRRNWRPSLGSCFTLPLLMGVATCGRTVTADNNFVQATPGCAILFALGQVPGVPDDNRRYGCATLNLDE